MSCPLHTCPFFPPCATPQEVPWAGELAQIGQSCPPVALPHDHIGEWPRCWLVWLLPSLAPGGSCIKSREKSIKESTVVPFLPLNLSPSEWNLLTRPPWAGSLSSHGPLHTLQSPQKRPQGSDQGGALASHFLLPPFAVLSPCLSTNDRGPGWWPVLSGQEETRM